MSEEKETSKLKNIAKFCFKNFINVVLALLTTYYFLLAFVLEISPTENKIILTGVIVLWVFWLFAKAIITLVMSFIVLILIGYGYYYYTHYDEIVCKNNGGVWNSEEKICEEKTTFIEKIKEAWKNRSFLRISIDKEDKDTKDKKD